MEAALARVRQDFPDLFKGSLVDIDGFPGTAEAYKSSNGKGDRPQDDHIVLMGHCVFHGSGEAGDEGMEKLLLVMQLSQTTTIEAFPFQPEGTRIKTMFEGVRVSPGGAMAAGILIATGRTNFLRS